jgi:hypothetical protein
MPVILVTQEAEVMRIAVQGQPKKIVSETPPISTNKLCLVAQVSNLIYPGGWSWAKSETLSEK